MKQWEKLVWVLAWCGAMTAAGQSHKEPYGAFKLISASWAVVVLEALWPAHQRWQEFSHDYMRGYRAV